MTGPEILFLVQAASLASTGLAIAEAVDSDDGPPGPATPPSISDAEVQAEARKERQRLAARRSRDTLISGGRPGATGSQPLSLPVQLGA